MRLQPSRRLFLTLWLLGIAGMAASLACSLWPASTDPLPPLEGVLAEDVPGVRKPPTRRAAEVTLGDEVLVVGVTAGGQSRAYVLSILGYAPQAHIVNDVLGGVPVSVTHCDVYNCTRVFSGGKPGEPLDLAVGGVKPGGLILKSGGHSYLQDSAAPLTPDDPPFPYDPHEGVVQTWGEWRRAHPDTDVYLGPTPPEPLTPEAAQAAIKAVVPVADPKPLPADHLTPLLVTALDVGGPPLLIAGVTLMIHVLLAFFLRSRRQDRDAPRPAPAAAPPPCGPGAGQPAAP